MKKLLTFLFVLTFFSVLTACNTLPSPKVNEPEKQDVVEDNVETNNDEEATNVEDNEVEVEEDQVDEVVDESDDSNIEEDKNDDQSQVDTNKNEEVDLAEAFQTYIDEISLLASEEVRIIEAYGSVSGQNYTNDSVMYDVIYNDVVPSYAEFVVSLEAISSDNEIVMDLHALYVEAATIQLGAFTVMLSALEQQSTDLVERANQGLAEASDLITEWQTQVQLLSVKTGVSF